MTVGLQLQNAMAAAMTRYNSIQSKWISVHARLLSQNGALQLLRYQSDYQWDLVLRCLEDEALQLIRDDKLAAANILVPNIQLSLSRYWILSMYEALRTAKESNEGKHNERLQRLYQRFRLIRVPITKLQIAGDRSMQDLLLIRPGDAPEVAPVPYRRGDYHPIEVLGTGNGSVGWVVIDSKTKQSAHVFRRDLSDAVLGFFD